MKRKYYRKCGECGARHEQSEMIRTRISDNGWLCVECYNETLEEALILAEANPLGQD